MKVANGCIFIAHVIIATLFMMIRLIAQDRHCPVDLFDKDKADHLMGESHFAQGYFLGSGFINSIAKTIGPADNENQALRNRMHLSFHIGGKLHRSKFFSFFIQQNQIVARL